MCRIFLSILLVPLLYFPLLQPMEFWSVDERSPLRREYINEQGTLHLLSDQSKGPYTNSFQNNKEDNVEENLNQVEKKEKNNSMHRIFKLHLGSWFRDFYTNLSQHEDSQKESLSDQAEKKGYPISEFPIEIRDHIIDFYSNGLVDNRKEVIQGLLYLMSIRGLLSDSYKEHELNQKIGLCHALYIMDKMEKVKTIEERQKLQVAASMGTYGKLFWTDMTEYSLWSSRLININVEQQLQEYIDKSQKYADFLEKVCVKFPELLPKHIPAAKEGENEGKDYYNDEDESDQSKLDLLPVIKSYYDTRRQFINDSCHLEGKLRDKVNAVFPHLTKIRYCTPLYCCWMGAGLCATALTQPAGALAVVTGLMGFGYYALGCVFCGVCCNCSEGRIKDKDCIEFCTGENTDMFEFITGLGNNQVHNQQAQNKIDKLAKGDLSEEGHLKDN